MNLSVNCMTRGPAVRVASQLALLRNVADEILVAVDDRADPEVARAMGAVADRVVLYPFAEPVDRPLPWLHEQCRGEWVLTIDDDEVPGSELIEQIPDLLGDERVTHYWLPRRWLYPDPLRYIDEHPWRSDYLLRLVRNDRRLLRFPTEPHRPIVALGPCRYLSMPLYHLDCVVNSRERREQKVVGYERFHGGKRTAGLPLNVAFYLPELRPDACTTPVPDRDAALITGVLDAPEPPVPADRSSQLARATRAEIDRLWEGRELGAADYAARIELAGDVRLVSGEARTVDVRVQNMGGVVWPWGDALPEIRLVSRWPELDGAEELRTRFPDEIRPGETHLVPMEVLAPSTPGRHLLEIDLVHEHVRWFGSGVVIEVDVLPVPRLNSPFERLR